MRFINTLALAAGIAVGIPGSGAIAGDAQAGESNFRQCASCHGIVDPQGDVFHRLAPSGPNLWGVVGRTAGTHPDYGRYSDSMVVAGAAGLVWDADNLVAYLQNPTGFLREYLDDDRARGTMNHRLRGSGEDIFAYLATFSGQ